MQADIVDNDQAGVTLLNTDGITVLSEGVSNDTFQVRLARPSTQAVTITLHADPQVVMSYGAEHNVSNLVLNFAAGDTGPRPLR